VAPEGAILVATLAPIAEKPSALRRVVPMLAEEGNAPVHRHEALAALSALVEDKERAVHALEREVGALAGSGSSEELRGAVQRHLEARSQLLQLRFAEESAFIETEIDELEHELLTLIAAIEETGQEGRFERLESLLTQRREAETRIRDLENAKEARIQRYQVAADALG
jgi:hypothetical protein